MDLTNKLKQWLIENTDVKSTSSDDEFKQAAATALVDGSLTKEKFNELTTTKADEEADEFTGLMTGIKDALTELKTLVKPETKEEEEEEKAAKEGEEKSQEKEKEEKGKKPDGKKAQSKTPSRLEKMVVSASQGSMFIDDEDGEEKGFDVRVKEAAEQYDDTKSALNYPDYTEKGRPHPKAGQRVMSYAEAGQGRPLENPSDLDKAVAGAYAQFVIATAQKKSRNLAFMSLPQHSKELLCYAMENMKWSGISETTGTAADNFANIKERRLTPSEQKALIDDSTSGGLEAAPIVFDDQVIQTPLLHGELFPRVNTVPLDRGRRVEGVSTGTVTGGWGGVDDSAISLFNTASYVSAFDTTIFRWEGAIRIGLDFLSDTPIDFGQHVTSQYGERLLEDLDDVIATGNGTTQPEGVVNKSGVTTVAFGGSTSIGNYESLRFGVAHPEHRTNVKNSAVFCGNETSYQRARAIPVGSSDARRLGGMDYDSYSWMERPYAINESLANTQIFYAILARYRMYQRRGLSIRTSTEGDTLIRRNEMLIVAMARYGGQLERGAVAAVTTTAEA